jgi:uncharacterized protein (DUF736 family)
MAEYKNSGVLFSQNVKKSEKAPDYTGDITLTLSDFEQQPDGTIKVRLAGWKRSSANGKTFLSLRGEQPRAKQDERPQSSSSAVEDIDNDIPF